MKTTWLIERSVFPATADRLIAAVESAGMRWIAYADDMPRTALPPDEECVVFYGSLNAAHENRSTWRWRPGAICNVEGLSCSTYYPRFREHLLNREFVFTTVEALVAKPTEIADQLGCGTEVFVRPDSPLKPFSGRVVSTRNLSLASLDHGFYYDDLDLPIAVSPVQAVTGEWRFVVTAGRIVASSSYEPEGRSGTDRVIPDGARSLALTVAQQVWLPDPVLVVDVCAVHDDFKLLELNSFSCSDLYDCDFDRIVAAVAPLAADLHAGAT